MKLSDRSQAPRAIAYKEMPLPNIDANILDVIFLGVTRGMLRVERD
jgi:hypothetical protein